MSESTIEMLILEGFGKIVGAPNHEKIATILADRAKLLDELNRLKKDCEQQQQTSQQLEVGDTMGKEQTPPPVTSPTTPTTPNTTSNRLLEDKLSLLEDEVRILRSTNENLSTQLSELLDSSAEAGSFLNKPAQVTESDDRKMIAAVKTAVENETVENEEENALLRLEVTKLDKDNMQLKMEVEKLYDEIGKFEIETKQLKGFESLLSF